MLNAERTGEVGGGVGAVMAAKSHNVDSGGLMADG
jgi:hypothetical protein